MSERKQSKKKKQVKTKLSHLHGMMLEKKQKLLTEYPKSIVDCDDDHIAITCQDTPII